MSPQKQRIAIAIACGWTRGHTGETQWVSDPHGIRAGWASMRAIADVALPDYLNDKNAMQEAKKVLTDKGLMLEFVNKLVGIVCSAMGLRWERLTTDDHLILVATATAEQEAEAFLRVMGLWEEGAQ